MTNDLLGRKTGIENIPAVLTDHLALVIRTSITTIEVRSRRGRWDDGSDVDV